MGKAAIIIPTYNEIENIEKLVYAIDALPIEKIIIIVDDNSPDGTGVAADRLAEERAAVQVIHRASKLGLGTAYTAGVKLGMELGIDRFVTMDADFSHDPQYIPQLIAQSEHYDVVIGSRYVSGGGTVNFGPHRKLISWVANALAHRVLKMEPRDCTSGFRCYRRRVLETIDPSSIVSDGYSFLVEMLFKVAHHGFSISEVPIIFVNRAQGASKISKKEIFKAIRTVWLLSRAHPVSASEKVKLRENSPH